MFELVVVLTGAGGAYLFALNYFIRAYALIDAGY